MNLRRFLCVCTVHMMLGHIPLYGYTAVCLTRFLIEGYLGSCQYLTVTNDVAKSVLLQLYPHESISLR